VWAISVERRQAFEKVFGDAAPHRIYVSAFSDFGEFGRKGGNITWGTEAWIAEVPNHPIHFDGSKLLVRKSFMKKCRGKQNRSL